MSIRLHRITSLQDACLGRALDLIEASFPDRERLPLSFWAGVFASWEAKTIIPAENDCQSFLFALRDGAGEDAVGMAYCQVYPFETERVGYLMYFCIDPAARNTGKGSESLQELLRWFYSEQGCCAVMLEAEDPEDASRYSQEEGINALRRIRFYRWHGARRLTGVSLHLQVHPAHEAVAFYPLVFAPEPLTPEAALTWVQRVEGDALKVVGPLGLE